MFYIISVKKTAEGINEYNLYDTHTASNAKLSSQEIITYVQENGIQIENATIANKGLVLKKWFKSVEYNETELKSGDTLTHAISDKIFYTTDIDGSTRKHDKENLWQLARIGRILNCRIDLDGNIKYNDVIEIDQDLQFEESIHERYKTYIAKANSLGKDYSFDYEIIGHEVRIWNYSGSSQDVILPNFITTIVKSAFYNKGIKSIKLNDGLNYIGKEAFARNNITSVVIPKTVEYIRSRAFSGNEKLSHWDLERDKCTSVIR